jgi:hypothetical protein
MTTANTTWFEFELIGKFNTSKYRTNPNARLVQFWSIENNKWKITKSATVRLLAINALKNNKAWTHNAPYNAEFLGAEPARAGQDY